MLQDLFSYRLSLGLRFDWVPIIPLPIYLYMTSFQKTWVAGDFPYDVGSRITIYRQLVNFLFVKQEGRRLLITKTGPILGKIQWILPRGGDLGSSVN